MSDKRLQQKEELKLLSAAIFQELKAQESMTLTYSGEDSLFVRINQAKIRQGTEVSQGFLSMDFNSHHRHSEFCFAISGELNEDVKRALAVLQNCRKECELLPDDPYIVYPESGESSEKDFYGKLLQREKLAESLLKPAESCDLAGLYASGIFMRAHMNSKGQFHWFSTENFYFDYSLYTPNQKAIKATYAGNEWKAEDYQFNFQQSKQQLDIMKKTPRKLNPGKYRAYLAPAAVAEILDLLSWSALSEKNLRQGHSPFGKLSEGSKRLSPLFSLEEDFNPGLVPRFNEFGEVSPLNIPLITSGKLSSLLVNKRTAQEYGLKSNGANTGENSRSLKIHPGNLSESKILSRLGTGIYISNLHYLTWSDRQHGRISGMTRYGCFWVENGEIISPIEDMRFDENLYDFWGECLEDFGEKIELVPLVLSYQEQSLGGVSVPGMLLNSFTFTL